MWEKEWNIGSGGPCPEASQRLGSQHVWFFVGPNKKIIYKSFKLDTCSLYVFARDHWLSMADIGSSLLPRGLIMATDVDVPPNLIHPGLTTDSTGRNRHLAATSGFT